MTSELKTTGASIMCLHDLLLDDEHFDSHAIDGTLLFYFAAFSPLLLQYKLYGHLSWPSHSCYAVPATRGPSVGGYVICC